MKLDTILDKVELGSMELPEFQRGYVWNREQVRNLFSSLYHRNPVGSLLVWETVAGTTKTRGEGGMAVGQNVQLLLDGQQRITSAYGVIRGKAPAFFDGNAKAFTGLHFHVDDESFEFYQPTKMAQDPLWVDVSKLMKEGLGEYITKMTSPDTDAVTRRLDRLSKLREIKDINIYIEEIAGKKTTEKVVEIFNVVNSGGTKLSQGDLTLAKICAEWPEARDTLKGHLGRWSDNGYGFKPDWLLRCLNAVLTGEANFRHLENRSPNEIRNGLERAVKGIDSSLNLIADRLGLDHDRVLFGRYAIPVMARFFDQQGGFLGSAESDRLLFWYVQAAMWGRFSGSTVTTLDQDLESLDQGGISGLLDRIRLWHGGLRVAPEHFKGSTLGARFYPMLYLLTRMGGARDFCSGAELKRGLLGVGARLEVHHIFPKAQLRKHGYSHGQINSLANFCFLTKNCNQRISDRLPNDYFPEVEAEYRDALGSQWIPANRDLWRIENYPDFLEARRNLLAAEANSRLSQLSHDEARWMSGDAAASRVRTVIGGITSERERLELENLNTWVTEQGLSAGELSFEHADPNTDRQVVFDLAWPEGVQAELTHPVAVLLDEGDELIRFANDAGYRFFTSTDAFKRYVEKDILKRDETGEADGGPASPN